MFNQSGSIRWTHFQSAVQTAVQRSAHKWTFEDFTQCFPLYVEEDKNGASTTFNSISDYIETQSLRDLEKIFQEYNVRENIDTLHRIVGEAKERKKKGISGNDVWKEDLDPQSAVSARTVPVLENEAKRLRESLATIEASNLELQSEIEENVKATDEADAQASALFDKLDSVLKEWEKISATNIEEWSVHTAETVQHVRPA